MITFSCACGQQLQVQDQHAGKQVRCPGCKTVMSAPLATGIEPVALPPAAPRGEFSERPPRAPRSEDRDEPRPTSRRPRDEVEDEDRPRRREWEDEARDDRRCREWDEEASPPRRRAQPKTSGLAIASLICGCVTFLIPVLAALPALLLGILGLRQVKTGGGRITGGGLAIAGIITGLVGNISLFAYMAGYQGFRQGRAQVVTINNMKQLGLAMHAFHDVNKGLPPAAFGGRPEFGGPFGPQAKGQANLSWRVAILPYIEQHSLYMQFRLDEPWDSPHNIQLLPRMPNIFEPVHGKTAPAGHTFFQVCTGPNTIFRDPFAKPRLMEIVDGTSNTIMIVEAGVAVPWTKPADVVIPPGGPLPPLGALDSNSFIACFADGVVRIIDRRRHGDPNILLAIDPRDGRPIFLD